MKGYRIAYSIEGFDEILNIKTLGANEEEAILNLRDSLNEFDNIYLVINSIVEIPLGSITIGELSVLEFEKYCNR